MDTLADRLRVTMTERGLTQQALADQIGTSQVFICKLLNNEITNSGFLIDIASVLGVSPQWLKFGNEEKIHKNPNKSNELKISEAIAWMRGYLEALNNGGNVKPLINKLYELEELIKS